MGPEAGSLATNAAPGARAALPSTCASRPRPRPGAPTRRFRGRAHTLLGALPAHTRSHAARQPAKLFVGLGVRARMRARCRSQGVGRFADDAVHEPVGEAVCRGRAPTAPPHPSHRRPALARPPRLPSCARSARETRNCARGPNAGCAHWRLPAGASRAGERRDRQRQRTGRPTTQAPAAAFRAGCARRRRARSGRHLASKRPGRRKSHRPLPPGPPVLDDLAAGRVGEVAAARVLARAALPRGSLVDRHARARVRRCHVASARGPCA